MKIQQAKNMNTNELLKAANCIYLACDEAVADDISAKLIWAANEINRLAAENQQQQCEECKCEAEQANILPCDVRLHCTIFKKGIGLKILLEAIERHNYYFNELQSELKRVTANRDAAVEDFHDYATQGHDSFAEFCKNADENCVGSWGRCINENCKGRRWKGLEDTTNDT